MALHAVFLSHYGLTPSFVQKLTDTYIKLTNDPFVGNVSRMKSATEPIEWVWMLSLFHFETLFLVPTFILGMVIMYKDWKAAYPFLIAYGASGAATALPCVAVILAIPDAATSPSPLAVTLSQRIMLLASYVPFILVPLGIAVELCGRTAKLIRAGLEAQDKRKDQ